MITKIEKVTLYVENQDEAKAFWTEKMGFSVTFEMPIGPLVWLEVAPAGAATSLVLYSKAAMQNHKPELVAHPSVIFSADNVESFHADLKAKGVVCEDIQNMPWGKMFNFNDQDGNPYMVRG